MDKTTFKNLRMGDLIVHKNPNAQRVWIVTGNYGGHITAVASMDVTNACEWDLIEHAKDGDK